MDASSSSDDDDLLRQVYIRLASAVPLGHTRVVRQIWYQDRWRPIEDLWLPGDERPAWHRERDM